MLPCFRGRSLTPTEGRRCPGCRGRCARPAPNTLRTELRKKLVRARFLREHRALALVLENGLRFVSRQRRFEKDQPVIDVADGPVPGAQGTPKSEGVQRPRFSRCPPSDTFTNAPAASMAPSGSQRFLEQVARSHAAAYPQRTQSSMHHRGIGQPGAASSRDVQDPAIILCDPVAGARLIRKR